VPKSGVTSYGVKEMTKRINATAGWLSGKHAAEVRGIQEIVGGEIVDEVKKDVMLQYKDGPLSRSYDYKVLGHSFIEVFTDLMIAPHGAMREVGGSIKATERSKFKGRDGRPQLVFKIGEDWIRTSKTIIQTGDYWLRDAMHRVIHDEYGRRGRRLSSLLGVSLTKMLTMKKGTA